MKENDPVFEFKKVTRVYEGGALVKALDSISFGVYEGDVFGIIGEKDSGRTTLVNMFTRLEDSTFGSVKYRGREVSKMNSVELKDLRRSVPTVINPLGLIEHRSVYENLSLAAKLFQIPDHKAAELISNILEKCYLKEVKDAAVASLPSLERLLTAIARVLTGGPGCIILDEPDSALSGSDISRAAEILKELKEEYGLTLVIATGSMKIVENLCNHAMVLEKGHLVECGGVLDIIRSPSSAAAKKLVYPENTPLEQYDSQGKRCVRIAFDGTSAKEPVIAGLVEETGEMVSILCANTKSIGGIGFGQMIVELPDDTIGAQKVINYFKKKGVFMEVVK